MIAVASGSHRSKEGNTARAEPPYFRSDWELVHAARNGCARSLDELMAITYELAHRNKFVRALPLADQDDTAQEVAICVLARLNTFTYRGSFSTWVFTISRWTSFALRRKNRRGTPRNWDGGPVSTSDIDNLPDPRPGPSEIVELAEELEAYEKHIDSLPVEFAETLRLHLDGVLQAANRIAVESLSVLI